MYIYIILNNYIKFARNVKRVLSRVINLRLISARSYAAIYMFSNSNVN